MQFYVVARGIVAARYPQDPPDCVVAVISPSIGLGPRGHWRFSLAPQVS
jgi:hypothetical protein